MKKRLIVFASGNGSNFINIYNKININDINGEICLLVSNNPDCNAIKFAVDNKIDFFIYNSHRFPNDQNQNSLIKNIKKFNPDLIILAGYMKKISHNMIDLFKNKILNIHPSLLPKYGGKGFYGIKVHEYVSKNKDLCTGATVHFIDYSYDTGPILLQKKIDIKKGEAPLSIAKKVLKIEHKIYFQAVQLFCDNRIYWENNKPLIKGQLN